jgi:hypothetical protein
LQPNRSSPFRKRLAAMLVRDEIRKKPPISLPGRSPTPEPTTVQKDRPPPTGRISYGPQLFTDGTSRLATATPTREDGFGPWTFSERLRMNYKFTKKLERAFKRGTEMRESASANYDRRSPPT